MADRTRAPAVQPPAAELVPVAVCAFSGYLASEACPERTTVLAPVHAVPTAPDPYHQLHEVDPTTDRAVLPACRVPGRAYERRSFVILPSAVSAWLAERNRAVPAPPRFADGCARHQHGPPTMLTPAEGRS